MRLATRVVAAALAAMAPATAYAHGGFWRAHGIHFDPDEPARVIVRSDVWGMVVSDDGGANWRWICAEAFGRDSTTPRRISVALARGRVFVASLGEGLWASSPDLCDWSPLPEFEGLLARDVRAATADGSVLFALTTESTGTTVTTRLWRSSDAGTTWALRTPALPSGFRGDHLAFAPSDPERLYVAGVDTGPNAAALARSDDSGAHWILRAVPGAAGLWESRVHGVDPKDANRVYVWIDTFLIGGSQFSHDTLLFSDDGGDSWSTLVESTSDLPGFAFSPDGNEVRIGGIDEGLWAGTTALVARKGTAALSRIHEGEVYGLTWNDDALFVGGNDYATDTPFSIGRSPAGDEQIEPWMSVCEVRESKCDAATRVGMLCPAHFSDQGLGAGGFLEDFIVTPRCTAPVGGRDAGPSLADDGGTDATAPASDARRDRAATAETACNCSTPGTPAAGPDAWLLLLIARRSARWCRALTTR